MTHLTEFRFFIELISRMTNQQVSALFCEEQGWVDFYSSGYKYHVQFLDGKFDHADILKYNESYEGYTHRRTYLSGYEFLANI